MLLSFLKKITGSSRRHAAAVDHAALLERAHVLALSDNRAAITAYRDYLERVPTDLEALNGLGACLADIGDAAQAAAAFELAYSLDDTFIPAMVNHAKLLLDQDKASEAIPFLERAKICRPSFMHTDAVYAGICLKAGQTERARKFQLKSALAHFDNLRLANCYLFWTAYDDVSERLVSAEHRFWAETLLPPVVDGPGDADAAGDDVGRPTPGEREASPQASRRIRIGYWSPDFRSHSVRFFFRPLLEAQDRERFEVFIYHDFPASDKQTQAIRNHADHFHEVFDKTDAQLCSLMRSHQLDILVELAGHTSHNRISLLHHRMATVQLTALGYPPTTGLRSVDGKLLDRFTSTDADRYYYAEKPVVLPTSFWCFDPKEDISIADEPPVVRNGFVTFGCVGNIAKITAPALRAWCDILGRVDGSRLVLRSISFNEPRAEQATRERLEQAGLPMDRVELLPPQGGLDFYASYDRIDIILDTYPFNGGTTTCFAAYMGLPVVGICGESLLGRMGRSVMANLGAAHLQVSHWDEYVRVAVATATDVEGLRAFKKQARSRFKGCALGNGALFAREFEQACVELLAEKSSGAFNWQPSIDVLPADEIMRRGYAVLRAGQPAAAQRIVDYCLREYPDSGAAHLLIAQQQTAAGQVGEALAFLRERLARFSPADRISAMIFMVRLHLVLDERNEAGAMVAELRRLEVNDSIDALQIALYEAALSPRGAAAAQPVAPAAPRSVHVVIPCDDDDQHRAAREQFEKAVACPTGWTVTYTRCAEGTRAAAYRHAIEAPGADIVLILQKNARVLQPWLLVDVAHALQDADVVSFAGASRWSRMDWRLDAFEFKAGALLSAAVERFGMIDVQVLGPSRAAVVRGMEVLDGTLLAIDARGELPQAWDEQCLGCETLLEEVWTHEAARAGARLAVCAALGVAVDASVALDNRDRVDARVHCASRYAFDPFGTSAEDEVALTVPAADVAEAARICRTYFGAST
jgi:predicted O-linked N-acetylglucosamine transferase (SPINDLY family)